MAIWCPKFREEPYDDEPRISAVQLHHELVRTVGGTVVDQDDFGGPVERVHNRAEPAIELLERFDLVENRDDERIVRVHVTSASGNPRSVAALVIEQEF